jgi:hypothetical protein
VWGSRGGSRREKPYNLKWDSINFHAKMGGQVIAVESTIQSTQIIRSNAVSLSLSPSLCLSRKEGKIEEGNSYEQFPQEFRVIRPIG